MADYDESMVEKLPTIGKAISFKNVRDGGDSNWEKKLDLVTDKAMATRVRVGENLNHSKPLAIAWNIKKHPQASQKQIAVADLFLEQYDKYEINQKTILYLFGIARSLNKK
jgi:hypothetical protein